MPNRPSWPATPPPRSSSAWCGLSPGHLQSGPENEAARTAYESRFVSWYHDDDGALVIKCRLPADMEGVFLAAMAEPARHQGRRIPRVSQFQVKRMTGIPSLPSPAPTSAGPMHWWPWPYRVRTPEPTQADRQA